MAYKWELLTKVLTGMILQALGNLFCRVLKYHSREGGSSYPHGNPKPSFLEVISCNFKFLGRKTLHFPSVFAKVLEVSVGRVATQVDLVKWNTSPT